MKVQVLTISLLLLGLTTPVRAQSQSDQVREIREQLRVLQEKLKLLDAPEDSTTTGQRTTQLGGRVRVREEPLPEEIVVVRAYDLSDLLALVSPYPAMVATDLAPCDTPLFPRGEPVSSGFGSASGMGGMGGMGMGGMGMGGGVTSGRTQGNAVGSPSSQPAPQNVLKQVMPQASGGVNGGRIDLEQLIDAIKSTIEPREWQDNGGEANIASLGNTLLISAKPHTHEQISKLFEVFRQRWGTLRTVSVHADWLWLTEQRLGTLLGAEQAKAGERPVFGLVNDAAWDSLMKELGQGGDTRPHGYHAEVTCYNGQTVHLVSGGQRRFVAGLIPVVGGNDTGYQPQVATLQEGAAIQITPMVTTGGKVVVLDVHSRVVLLDEKPAPAGLEVNLGKAKPPAREAVSALDRPHVLNQHLETTLRVPVDRRILVGGMTFASQPKPGEPGLYLFIRPGVQELRDDQTVRPDAMPLKK